MANAGISSETLHRIYHFFHFFLARGLAVLRAEPQRARKLSLDRTDSQSGSAAEVDSCSAAVPLIVSPRASSLHISAAQRARDTAFALLDRMQAVADEQLFTGIAAIAITQERQACRGLAWTKLYRQAIEQVYASLLAEGPGLHEYGSIGIAYLHEPEVIFEYSDDPGVANFQRQTFTFLHAIIDDIDRRLCRYLSESPPAAAGV